MNMSETTTAAFLSKGSPGQFRFVLSLYEDALKIKAESKSKKPQDLIKLDQWYQREFPSKIKARGKDPFIIHDELVQCMKWKLARGKFRPRLKELVTMNSPRVVEQESKKAFRALFKKDDLAASIQYLCNLKGIGPATASAIITAAAPDRAAYMADECLAAVPEIEGIDYTLDEYMELLKHIRQAVQRLGTNDFTPHTIELALWTHNVLLQYKPELLQRMPNEIAPQEDSLGSTISNGSKDVDEDSNSNLGLNQVSPNEDSNMGTESERGEDSNSVDTFQAHVKKNGLGALSTDSNDSSSLQNGQLSSTEDAAVKVGTKREAPSDDSDEQEESSPTSDEPSIKKVKIADEEVNQNSETSQESAPDTTTTTPVAVVSTNGDGH
ncbi:unnamed protein product [Orchesella dallaii]|uniref:Uncharacterized protein n=1 Tax=Orchesella dallaii TaxID=48710 RepID=A0ABP1RE26_9HEXA